MILTARMRLVPATVVLARAELMDRARFAELLSGTVPDQWPPEILADALPAFLDGIETSPDQVGWFVWYGLIRAPGETDAQTDVLGASAGFRGPPKDGTAEMGYSVLPQFQRQGYAAEMIRALLDWAFAQPNVQRVVAEVAEDNSVSMHLLDRLSFTRIGPGEEPGHIRFVLNGHRAKSYLP